MWIEVDEVERLAEIRTREALSVGAEIIATACPWCFTQLEHAIKTTGNEEKIEVRDLAELLHEATSQ